MLKFKYITLMILTVFCLTAAQAKIIDLESYGGIPNDGKDDTRAIQTAVNELAAAGGGTIIFPSGTLEMEKSVEINPRAVNLSYFLKGDGGSVIRLNGGSDIQYFTVYHLNQVEFDGLTFIGGADQQNAFSVIVSTDVNQTKVSNCMFHNVASSDTLIEAQDTDLTVDKTMFDGSSATDSLVRASNSRGLTVSNSIFESGEGYWNAKKERKFTQSSNSWVRIYNDGPIMDFNGQRTSRIIDSRFDMSPKSSISIENQKSVEINGVVMCIRQEPEFAGINFSNVEYAEVKNSKFVSDGPGRPAMKLANNTYALVNSLTFSEGMTTADSDGTSILQVGFCPQCVAPLKAKRSLK